VVATERSFFLSSSSFFVFVFGFVLICFCFLFFPVVRVICLFGGLVVIVRHVFSPFPLNAIYSFASQCCPIVTHNRDHKLIIITMFCIKELKRKVEGPSWIISPELIFNSRNYDTISSLFLSEPCGGI
jgi:hypothetical protein